MLSKAAGLVRTVHICTAQRDIAADRRNGSEPGASQSVSGSSGSSQAAILIVEPLSTINMPTLGTFNKLIKGPCVTA